MDRKQGAASRIVSHETVTPAGRGAARPGYATDELVRINDLLADGTTLKAIAAAIGRPYGGLRKKMSRLREVRPYRKSDLFIIERRRRADRIVESEAA